MGVSRVVVAAGRCIEVGKSSKLEKISKLWENIPLHESLVNPFHSRHPFWISFWISLWSDIRLDIRPKIQPHVCR